MFLPKIGAISAFLTTIWIEMMMIEICMVTITLQLCVIIKMKTESLFFVWKRLLPRKYIG